MAAAFLYRACLLCVTALAERRGGGGAYRARAAKNSERAAPFGAARRACTQQTPAMLPSSHRRSGTAARLVESPGEQWLVCWTMISSVAITVSSLG